MNHAEKISIEEKSIAREVLRGDRNLVESLFFQSSLDRNQDLRFLPPLKKVAIVGSGSVPTTAMSFHKLGVCSQLTLIDIDDEALELGQQLLALADIKAEMVNSPGELFDFSSFDGVYIANLVQNKRDVLRACENQLVSGAQLVLRCATLELPGVDSFGPSEVETQKWKLLKEGAGSDRFKSKNYFYQKI